MLDEYQESAHEAWPSYGSTLLWAPGDLPLRKPHTFGMVWVTEFLNVTLFTLRLAKFLLPG